MKNILNFYLYRLDYLNRYHFNYKLTPVRNDVKRFFKLRYRRFINIYSLRFKHKSCFRLNLMKACFSSFVFKFKISLHHTLNAYEQFRLHALASFYLRDSVYKAVNSSVMPVIFFFFNRFEHLNSYKLLSEFISQRGLNKENLLELSSNLTLKYKYSYFREQFSYCLKLKSQQQLQFLLVKRVSSLKPWHDGFSLAILIKYYLRTALYNFYTILWVKFIYLNLHFIFYGYRQAT